MVFDIDFLHYWTIAECFQGVGAGFDWTKASERSTDLAFHELQTTRLRTWVQLLAERGTSQQSLKKRKVCHHTFILWQDANRLHIAMIRLVQVEGRTYKDRVMWDLNEPQNSPDEFAFSVCTDLGLPMSFVDPIRTDVLKQLVEKWKVGTSILFSSVTAHDHLCVEGARCSFDDVLSLSLGRNGWARNIGYGTSWFVTEGFLGRTSRANILVNFAAMELRCLEEIQTRPGNVEVNHCGSRNSVGKLRLTFWRVCAGGLRPDNRLSR